MGEFVWESMDEWNDSMMAVDVLKNWCFCWWLVLIEWLVFMHGAWGT